MYVRSFLTNVNDDYLAQFHHSCITTLCISCSQVVLQYCLSTFILVLELVTNYELVQ